MENKETFVFALQELRIDNIRKQKKGVHFILASIIIWGAVLGIHLSPLPILTKNLYTFFCSAPLVPLAYLISKLIGVDFQNKDNPLSKLGLLFALNQMLYILIAMWVYEAVPDKMLMVYAMIFGAHLLPYGWLYQSKVYYIFSVVIPVIVLLTGLFCPAAAVAALMLLVEIVFAGCLLF
ncbi:MAG: hypothetical protein PUB10_01930 [Clostridiales bacterium]|nr:hypothetical protein [Clostridiales bacterium]